MTLRKYSTVFSIASRDQLIYLPSFLARNIFFVVVMFVFFSLWRAVFGTSSTVAGFTVVQMLWYLSFTEAIELSQSRIFIPISEEVKDGTVAYSLNRPYSYVFFWISRAMGENLVKVVPLLAEGFVLALILVGPLPGYVHALPVGLVAVVLGVLMGASLQMIIGLLAFWFEEVMPFWWIIQKLVFVIGGMFIPIDVYPDWLQRISRYTPFAFAAYWPATVFVDFTPERVITTIVGQVAYIAIFFGIALAMFRVAVKRLHAHGG